MPKNKVLVSLIEKNIQMYKKLNLSRFEDQIIATRWITPLFCIENSIFHDYNDSTNFYVVIESLLSK